MYFVVFILWIKLDLWIGDGRPTNFPTLITRIKSATFKMTIEPEVICGGTIFEVESFRKKVLRPPLVHFCELEKLPIEF